MAHSVLLHRGAPVLYRGAAWGRVGRNGAPYANVIDHTGATLRVRSDFLRVVLIEADPEPRGAATIDDLTLTLLRLL